MKFKLGTSYDEVLADPEIDAVILATAGVKRAGLMVESEMAPIPVETMLPAAGQAALALQYRKDDAAVREVVAARSRAPRLLRSTGCLSCMQESPPIEPRMLRCTRAW